MEAKLKHLELIQAVVSRLADASFKMKGWCVAVVSALLVLLAGSDRPGHAAFVAWIPVTLFWTLDSYYLSQEKLFRKLYEHVRTLDPGRIDFSMDVKPFQETGRFGLDGWGRATKSPAIWLFYLMLSVLAPIGALMIGGVR